MRASRSKPPRLIILLWSLNALGVLTLLAILVLYLSQHSALAASQADTESTATPTITPFPTRHDLPTVTPNPHSTQIVVSSPTPFVLFDGQEPRIIGYSVSGRPIEVYAFGQGERRRMIVAGIHGGYEWNTIALADQMITYLTRNPGAIPGDVTLYILRDLNPDGDARDHGIDGRVNDAGVDLNRNFPVNWSATWDRQGCFDRAPTTSGEFPASEPETRAIINFLGLRPVGALISYHSAALGASPGGEPWDESSVRLAKDIAAVSSYPFPPIMTGCAYAGTLADYAASRGMAAVDLELSDHDHTEFEMNLRVLKVLMDFEK